MIVQGEPMCAVGDEYLKLPPSELEALLARLEGRGQPSTAPVCAQDAAEL